MPEVTREILARSGGILLEDGDQSYYLDRYGRHALRLPRSAVSEIGPDRLSTFLDYDSRAEPEFRAHIHVLAGLFTSQKNVAALRLTLAALIVRYRVRVEVHFTDPAVLNDDLMDGIASLGQGLPDSKRLALSLSGPFRNPDERILEAIHRDNIHARVVHGWWPGCKEADYSQVREETLRAMSEYGIVSIAVWHVHGKNIDELEPLIERSLRANYYSGFSLSLHFQHPGWTEDEAGPPMSEVDRYIKLLGSAYESHPHYDVMFGPLNDLVTRCALGSWDCAGNVPSNISLLFKGDGSIGLCRQLPYAARLWATCEAVARYADGAELLESLTSFVRAELDWNKDDQCGGCEWRFICGGVDAAPDGASPAHAQMGKIISGYRKLFLEAFMLYRVRTGGIPVIPTESPAHDAGTLEPIHASGL